MSPFRRRPKISCDSKLKLCKILLFGVHICVFSKSTCTFVSNFWGFRPQTHTGALPLWGSELLDPYNKFLAMPLLVDA